MSQNLLWLLTIGLVRVSENVVTAVEKDGNISLVNCIAQAAVLAGRLKVDFRYSQDYEDLVPEILKKVNVPLILNTREMRKPGKIELRASNNLILILGATEPELMTKETLWDVDSKFLIVPEDEGKVFQYFQDFWKLKIVNVFALIREDEDIVLRSFMPFRGKECGIELVEEDRCRNGVYEKKGKILTERIRLKKLNGCPVNISVTDIPPSTIYREDSETEGFEPNLMRELGAYYNFTAVFRKPEDNIGWGWVHPTPHGVVGEVYKRFSEFGIGMLAPLMERFEYLTLAKPYNVDECVTFTVPQGSGMKNPAWIATFVLEFTISTWLLIAFSFVLITINMWLINRYSDVNWFGTKTEMVILVFSSCLGAQIKIPRSVSAKMSLAYWIIFSFIITVVYKTFMGSKLTIPPRDADIYTLDELLKTDLELNGYKNMYQLLVEEEQTVLYQRLRKRYIFANFTAEQAVDLIAHGSRYAHLIHASATTYYSQVNPAARGKIHVLKECVIVYRPNIITQRYSVLGKQLNGMISRLEESGIMPMWRSKYKINIPQSKQFLRLSLEQVAAVIYTLLLGHFIAFLAFLWEIFYCFKQPKKFKFRL